MDAFVLAQVVDEVQHSGEDPSRLDEAAEHQVGVHAPLAHEGRASLQRRLQSRRRRRIKRRKHGSLLLLFLPSVFCIARPLLGLFFLFLGTLLDYN